MQFSNFGNCASHVPEPSLSNKTYFNHQNQTNLYLNLGQLITNK